MGLSAAIAARIEAVREHFELADNWPTEPFRLNAWSQVADPAEFVDGHLTFLLAVQNDVLALPYLGRIEFVMEMLQEMAQDLPPEAVAPPEAKGTPPPPKEEGSEQDLEESAHGGEGRQLVFF